MGKKVCITGGAGYVGSHCAVKLIENGYDLIILDNFSNSSFSVIKKIEKLTKKKNNLLQSRLKRQSKDEIYF